MRILILLSLVAGAFSSGCDTIACEAVKDPVCGSDSVTYLNACYLKVTACKYATVGKTLTLVSNGECGTKTNVAQIDTNTLVATKCDMNCGSTTDKYPICGSDGVTYANKCYFYEAQCVHDARGERFDLAHVGECRHAATSLSGSLGTSPCSIDRCDSTPQKLCASDGNVYGSECEFLKAQCGNPRLTKVDCSTFLTSTFVADRCSGDMKCDSAAARICGSDGVVYGSQCEFLRAKCSSGGSLMQVRCQANVLTGRR